jgi:hypothetical protein
LPVAVLSNEATLDRRLRAIGSGAVAVIERGASVDAIARRVAEVAKELPDQAHARVGELGEATLDELVALVSRNWSFDQPHHVRPQR